MGAGVAANLLGAQRTLIYQYQVQVKFVAGRVLLANLFLVSQSNKAIQVNMIAEQPKR